MWGDSLIMGLGVDLQGLATIQPLLGLVSRVINEGVCGVRRGELRLGHIFGLQLGMSNV